MILFAPGDYVLRAAGALRPPTVRLLIRKHRARVTAGPLPAYRRALILAVSAKLEIESKQRC